MPTALWETPRVRFFRSVFGALAGGVECAASDLNQSHIGKYLIIREPDGSGLVGRIAALSSGSDAVMVWFSTMPPDPTYNPVRLAPHAAVIVKDR